MLTDPATVTPTSGAQGCSQTLYLLLLKGTSSSTAILMPEPADRSQMSQPLVRGVGMSSLGPSEALSEALCELSKAAGDVGSSLTPFQQ